MSEPDRPKSSWQTWVRSAQQRNAAQVEGDADLDVVVAWGDHDASAAGDGNVASAELASSDDWAVPFDDVDYDDDDGAHGHDDGEYGELLPSVPLLPSIAGRVEALSGLLRSISHRLESLDAATDAYRSATVDRIDGFTDLVLEQGRRSDAALDEYRRSTERTVAELRRRVSEQAELAGRFVARMEEVASDVAAVLESAGAGSGWGTAPGPGADDGVPAGVEAALDELRAGQAATDGAVAELRELVEVVLDTLPGSAEGTGADLGVAVDRLQATVDALAAVPPPAGPVVLDEDTVARLADAVVDRLDLDALGMLVAEHLTANFEVVTDDVVVEPPPPAPPAADAPVPAGRRQRRR